MKGHVLNSNSCKIIAVQLLQVLYAYISITYVYTIT